jgi:hypothetical protein
VSLLYTEISEKPTRATSEKIAVVIVRRFLGSSLDGNALFYTQTFRRFFIRPKKITGHNLLVPTFLVYL